MKIKNCIKLLILLLVLMVIPNAKAASCDYKIRSEMSKIAKNVSAAYEVKEDEYGHYYFVITIYNIVDGIYVSISETGGKSTYRVARDIFNSDTNGTNNYTFTSYNIEDVVKYTIKVGEVQSGCNSSSLRSFSLTKPRYNGFSELEECGFFGVEDLVYCQKWVTTKINLTEEGVIEKIKQFRKKNLGTVTTQCISCEENAKNQEKLARFYKIRKYIIIGLSCGIAADLALIVFLFIKIKKEII